MRWLSSIFLRLEAAWHRADEYLALNRGDALFAADCGSRASECDRRLATMEIQP